VKIFSERLHSSASISTRDIRNGETNHFTSLCFLLSSITNKLQKHKKSYEIRNEKQHLTRISRVTHICGKVCGKQKSRLARGEGEEKGARRLFLENELNINRVTQPYESFKTQLATVFGRFSFS
jgi:hypothetical protein